MKKIKLKYLRSLLFFLLALLFAGVAVIVALPPKTTGDYIQNKEITLTSQKKVDGTYLYTASGFIQNVSSKTKFLDGVVIRIKDGYGDYHSLEVEVNDYIPANATWQISGEIEGKAPTAKVDRVSTLVEDNTIQVPATGLQLSRPVIVFAVLSAVSFCAAVFFLIWRMTHRRHRHHSKKPSA